MNGSNFSLGGDGKVVEGSLERQGQAQLNEIKKMKNRGSGAGFPYLGIKVPKYKNCSNFSLIKDGKVVAGSLKAYGQAEFIEIRQI